MTKGGKLRRIISQQLHNLFIGNWFFAPPPYLLRKAKGSLVGPSVLVIFLAKLHGIVGFFCFTWGMLSCDSTICMDSYWIFIEAGAEPRGGAGGAEPPPLLRSPSTLSLRRCNPLLNRFTWQLLPPKLDRLSFSYLWRCLYSLCYLKFVTYNLNALLNSQGVVDLSLQVYVPLNPSVKVKCFKGNSYPYIQYLSWFEWSWNILVPFQF
jgi:hypothetical protein